MSYRNIARLAAVVIAAAAPLAAHAQTTYRTQANIYGEPQFGTTTTGSDGSTYRTQANIYGQPQFGTTTTGSNGSHCRTDANIYGEPQYGTHTTCN